MKQYLVDVAWNHKGARYEKAKTVRVAATNAARAAGAALAEVRKKEPESVREVPNARFHFTVTVIDQTVGVAT